eukprot:1152972-Pleurochrysis_carterae.AAC.1
MSCAPRVTGPVPFNEQPGCGARGVVCGHRCELRGGWAAADARLRAQVRSALRDDPGAPRPHVRRRGLFGQDGGSAGSTLVAARDWRGGA